MAAVPRRNSGRRTWILEPTEIVRPIELEAYGPITPSRGQQTVWCKYLRCDDENQHTLK